MRVKYGAVCGSRAGKILPAPVSDKIFVEILKFRQNSTSFQNRQNNSTSFCNERMFIWIFVHLNKSSFNFVRLIFRSRHSFRSRRFCGSWLQSVSRLSALVAVMPTLLAEIINPMRLNARSQFAEAAKMGKMKIAVLTRNEGKVSRICGSCQKHRGSASYFFFNCLFFDWLAIDVLLTSWKCQT